VIAHLEQIGALYKKGIYNSLSGGIKKEIGR
jgi:hypothetical protein